MFTISLSDLKNTVKVAKHTMEPKSMNAKIKNDKRDIKIEVTYYPEKNVKEDIYPYWLIWMIEEEETAKVNICHNDKGLHEVRDIFNNFCLQGDESFLENFIPY